MSQELALAHSRIAELEQVNAELRLQVDALERIQNTAGALCVTDAAKALGMQPKKLFLWLQAYDWIYRRGEGGAWAAYQPRLTSGFLQQRVKRLTRIDGSTKLVEQILITPKGLIKLAVEIERRTIA